jgi:hypothetical protein
MPRARIKAVELAIPVLGVGQANLRAMTTARTRSREDVRFGEWRYLDPDTSLDRACASALRATQLSWHAHSTEITTIRP